MKFTTSAQWCLLRCWRELQNSKHMRCHLTTVQPLISSRVKHKKCWAGNQHISKGCDFSLGGYLTELFGALTNDTPVSFLVWQFTECCLYASCLRSHGQVHCHPQPDSQPLLIHPDCPRASWGAWETRLTWSPWWTRTPRHTRLPRKCRRARDPRRTR